VAHARTDLQALPDLLTTAEVARLLRLSPQRIRQMAAADELEAYHVGRKWRFWRDDVLRILGEGPRS
jgi:excisionase family DNA binding protein